MNSIIAKKVEMETLRKDVQVPDYKSILTLTKCSYLLSVLTD